MPLGVESCSSPAQPFEAIRSDHVQGMLRSAGAEGAEAQLILVDNNFFEELRERTGEN
jgi:hypothetical protein